jgi:DNA-binding response OmpR family regulator
MGSPNPPHILLVCDDPAGEAQACRILSKYRFANPVVTLRRASEVLRYFSQFDTGGEGAPESLPHMIILSLEADLQAKVAHASRKNRLAGVPLIVVAASRLEEEAVRGLSLPRTHCMGRPLGFFKLLEAMQKLGMYWMVLKSSPR